MSTSSFERSALVFQGAALLLTSMPGVAALTMGMGVPSDMTVMFGAAYLVVGVWAIMLTALFRRQVGKLARRTVALMTSLGLGLGFVSFFLYRVAYRAVVVFVADERDAMGIMLEFYFPLWIRGDLAEMLDLAGSVTEAVVIFGPERVLQELAEPYHALSMAITDGVLLALFCITSLMWISALSVLGWRLQEDVQ